MPDITIATAATAATTATITIAATTDWWRVPMVWLVISGPALVVVASFATLALAILNPDPVLKASATANPAEQPAVQARNHAASPRR